MSLRKLSRNRKMSYLILLNQMLREGLIKIASTPSQKELIESVLKLRDSDIKQNGWFHKGFLYIRLSDDFIEIKTIDEQNPKSFTVSIDNESLATYINYLKRLSSAMTHYRKIPVLVDAVQLTAGNIEDVMAFCGDKIKSHPMTGVVIETLEGNMIASVGDYIIKGVKGEFYPCKPDIFEATYEAVEVKVGEDMICPVTKQHCDDECCPPGATCNLSNDQHLNH